MRIQKFSSQGKLFIHSERDFVRGWKTSWHIIPAESSQRYKVILQVCTRVTSHYLLKHTKVTSRNPSKKKISSMNEPHQLSLKWNDDSCSLSQVLHASTSSNHTFIQHHGTSSRLTNTRALLKIKQTEKKEEGKKSFLHSLTNRPEAISPSVQQHTER